MTSSQHVYGRLWHGKPNAVSNAMGYAKFYSRSHDAVIRVYDDAGNVIATPDHAGDLKDGEALHVKQKAAMQKRGGSFASCCCLGGQTVGRRISCLGGSRY